MATLVHMFRPNLAITLCRRHNVRGYCVYLKRSSSRKFFYTNCLCGNDTVQTTVLHNRHFPNIGHRCYNAGLTDDILKNKLNASGAEQKKSQDGDQKKESWFSGQHSWKLGLLTMSFFSLTTAGMALWAWGAPEFDENGEEVKDEYSDLPILMAYLKRFTKACVVFQKLIQEPSSKKLLPDPVKEPYYQPPYTVVFELTGVLVHPDWTLETGWRFKKRPHIDYLFKALQSPGLPLFEIVIYTHEGGMTAFPIIDGIDKENHVSFRLFRDATRYINGTHCKDLSCLNRDESKLIIVDCDPKAVQLQPRNSVNLRKWTGQDEDSTLIELGHFLRTIAASNVSDVRTVLDYYNQYDDPLEAFKEKQKQLQEQEMASKSVDTGKSKSLVGNWSAGLRKKL